MDRTEINVQEKAEEYITPQCGHDGFNGWKCLRKK